MCFGVPTFESTRNDLKNYRGHFFLWQFISLHCIIPDHLNCQLLDKEAPIWQYLAMSPIRRCTRTAIKHNKQNRNLFLIFVVYNAGTINSHVKTSYLCKLCESHLHNFCTTDCSLCFYAEAMLVDCFADHCHCCGNFHYCMDNLE